MKSHFHMKGCISTKGLFEKVRQRLIKFIWKWTITFSINHKYMSNLSSMKTSNTNTWQTFIAPFLVLKLTF